MDILTALAPIIVPVLFPVVVAASVYAYQHLMQRSPERTHALVSALATTVVRGVEQYSADTLGSHKKTMATEALEAILVSMHISVPAQLIDLAIESAVGALETESQYLLYDAAPPSSPNHTV